jgi:hypothetical protein
MPLTLTPGAVAVLAGNPGLTLSDAHINAVSRGILVLSTSLQGGCIKHLRYGDNDTDLDVITLEDGGTTTVWTSAQIQNLAAFRETLQRAACCGQRVTFCVNTEEKKMFMLNVYPCQCPCKKDHS